LRTQAREEVAVGGVGRQPGLEILQRVRNFIGFEQQIVEFLREGPALEMCSRSRSAPAISPFASRTIASRHPCRRFFSGSSRCPSSYARSASAYLRR
jgi:hypothetical protein